MKQRKKEHLDLALQSQTLLHELDERFIYEPMFKAHPNAKNVEPFEFMGKQMRYPIWVSSMTGGTEYAGHINRNLAKVCKEFGFGMGLGSCRALLSSNEYLDQFNMREVIGDDLPLWSNLGICQVEESLHEKSTDLILKMLERLDADGLFIHINPLQEWMQPEGDKIKRPPIETIQEFIEVTGVPVAVKEVGQGFGKKSLKALLELPLEALEFGAYGGTNFAKIELERSEPVRKQLLEPIAYVGNSALQMVDWCNEIVETLGDLKTKNIIVSGGLRSYLDGYFFIERSKLNAVYGMASQFLRFAREDYGSLQEFATYQVNGLNLARHYLEINPDFEA